MHSKRLGIHGHIVRATILVALLVCLFCVVSTMKCRFPREGPEHVQNNQAGLLSTKYENCTHNITAPVTFHADLPLKFERQPHPPTAKVPSILHFTFGMAGGDEIFDLVHFLSIASALNVLKPERAIVHCQQEPAGFYWEMLRPHVELIKARQVTEIFGNPVHLPEHKSDVIRLEALLKYGGIYLDTDVFVLRPFTHLVHHDYVMGQEGPDGSLGLCNAVIIASKNSIFLQRRYDEYKTFNGSVWGYHSVVLPREMARLYPEQIKILDYKTFFWPLWTAEGRDMIFAGHEYNYETNLAVHVWGSLARKEQLRGFSQMRLLQCRSTLLSMMRTYIPVPLFSIVMQCHPSISQSIQSLVAQTWPSWELIVVNNGTRNRYCIDALRRLKQDHHGVAQLQSAQFINSGRTSAEALNAAIDRAKGPWIAVVRQHHVYKRNFLQTVEMAATQDPRLQLIVTDMPVAAKNSGNSSQYSEYVYLRSIWRLVGGFPKTVRDSEIENVFLRNVRAVGTHGFELSKMSAFDLKA